MEFDHLGVFVKSLDLGQATLQRILPIASASGSFHDPLLRVSVRFLYDTSGICYELVAPNGPGNPVEAVLSDRRSILNHVAYRETEFDARIDTLRAARCIPLGRPQPAVAFDGARVMFLLTPLRMIIELIEAGPGTAAIG
jgi:methylmalonyl-CoA/ethylmalonyl-CoA epimerase